MGDINNKMNIVERINEQIIHIDIEEADALAIEYFINICGFRREGEKYKRLLKHGMEIKERIKDKVDIRAVYSCFNNDVISDNKIDINSTTFECKAFEQMDKASIIKIYPYILSAGTYDLDDEEPIMNRLYADIWGTAYVDAGLEVLKNKLKKEYTSNTKDNLKSVVLDSFGPGYYGMDVSQVGNFFKILDSEKIETHVRSNNIMIPLKSCTGFIVVVDDENHLPSADCKSCCANVKGCDFCQAVIKKRSSSL